MLPDTIPRRAIRERFHFQDVRNAIKAIGKQLRALTVRHLRKCAFCFTGSSMTRPSERFWRSGPDIRASSAPPGRAYPQDKNCILYACCRQLLTNRLYHYRPRYPALYMRADFRPSGTICRYPVRIAAAPQATQEAHYLRPTRIMFLPLFRVCPGITTRKIMTSVPLCFMPRDCCFTFGAVSFFTSESVNHGFHFLDISPAFSLLMGLLRGAAYTREKSPGTDKQASRSHSYTPHGGK